MAPRFCTWDEFLRVMKSLGYTQEKPPARGGAGVPFSKGNVRKNFHRPHNGAVIRPKFMARRLGITEQEFMELAK